jgi:TRAP-type uncharacterized transport system substrate-binding protein
MRASQLNDLVFLDIDEAVLAKMVKDTGYERATLPLAYMRGVDRPIPTISHTVHYIYVRDDTPESFAYILAKALDEHRELFQQQGGDLVLRSRAGGGQSSDSSASGSIEVLSRTRLHQVGGVAQFA